MTTKIEWTDETWNPVTGCTKVSPGCKNCYAERLWPKVAGAEAKREGRTIVRPFTQPRYHQDRLEQPFLWAKPRRIFVNSMSDLFHEDIDDEEIRAVLTTAANAHWHQFQILTKRPARMLKIMSDLLWVTGTPPAIAEYVSGRRHLHIHRSVWREAFEKAVTTGEIKVEDGGPVDKPIMPAGAPENIWLGVSVEDKATAAERIPLLVKTPAAVRFLSLEPLLGSIDLRPFLLQKACDRCTQGVMDSGNGHLHGRCRCACHESTRLHWVIAGGESGPNARPAHPDWFRSIRDQCAGAGVPFFFKQWGEWAPCDTDVDAGDYGRTLHPHEETVTEAMALIERGFTVTEAHGCEFFRAGKKLAGRHLDGRIHDDYPTTSNQQL